MDAPVGAIAGAARRARPTTRVALFGARAGGAFVVTALGLGSTFFFKSGFEAQARRGRPNDEHKRSLQF